MKGPQCRDRQPHHLERSPNRPRALISSLSLLTTPRPVTRAEVLTGAEAERGKVDHQEVHSDHWVRSASAPGPSTSHAHREPVNVGQDRHGVQWPRHDNLIRTGHGPSSANRPDAVPVRPVVTRNSPGQPCDLLPVEGAAGSSLRFSPDCMATMASLNAFCRSVRRASALRPVGRRAGSKPGNLNEASIMSGAGSRRRLSRPISGDHTAIHRWRNHWMSPGRPTAPRAAWRQQQRPVDEEHPTDAGCPTQLQIPGFPGRTVARKPKTEGPLAPMVMAFAGRTAMPRPAQPG